jgi:D-lyxose ketol-isomerase
MKRSFIESRIAMMLAQCARHGLTLPPFAQWTPEQFRADQASAGRIAAGGLGWNIVEFAPGAFTAPGLSAFTVRMGDWHDLAKGGGRLYGEKALMLEDGQGAPHHYHVVKTEDILNRGGGRLMLELFKVDCSGRRLHEPFRVLKDATMIDLEAGGRVALEPGESIVLEPYVAHSFWAEGGLVVAGEVSLANDDTTDNYFVPALAPPDPIDEDITARYVTVRDHHALLGPAS